jgi:hypothetical protein
MAMTSADGREQAVKLVAGELARVFRANWVLGEPTTRDLETWCAGLPDATLAPVAARLFSPAPSLVRAASAGSAKPNPDHNSWPSCVTELVARYVEVESFS